MGKLQRVACIALPYILTISALVCLVFVASGSVHPNHKVETELYFLRVDLSNLSNPDVSSKLSSLASSAIQNLTGETEALAALEKADDEGKIRDFYDIGLWNYCAGNKTSKGDFDVDYCSKTKAMFWFDAEEVWGLNGTGANNLFSHSLKDGMKAYHYTSKWMFIAYMVALVSTAFELLVGISAIFSRLGSCITSFVSGVSTIFTLAASITSTAMFLTLDGVLNTALKDYEIHSSVGRRMLALTWIATAFSLASGLFWALSSCCCSGQSSRARGPREYPGAEKVQPYMYEQVVTPYMGGGGMQQHPDQPYHAGPAPEAGPQMAPSAYEPFRHTGVDHGA